jgi:hypothetical protein
MGIAGSGLVNCSSGRGRTLFWQQFPGTVEFFAGDGELHGAAETASTDGISLAHFQSPEKNAACAELLLRTHDTRER